ncbi:putative vacuolar carboxypeptidase Cps1 [Coniochaeta ligniaria NRRL 30616]|uniref:Putative vacuolar carboxypeptidase Cps1 n=1 Tax=Coniochaeta ligniaria NRRL 30616 TaxID=1408157 RepID=A0A1J7J0P7_9PEZI|nr:putative vacuolar carboxypeptidase Cps1 [Coniochaeta ligniaria NRRL 30616]
MSRLVPGFLCLLSLLCLVPLYRVCPLQALTSRFLDGWASKHHTGPGVVDWCPLPDVVAPRDDGLKPSEHLMGSTQRDLQVRRLSSAVQVPTESYDDNGDVDDDPRWATFGDFHSLLVELFPLVHSSMDLQKVNRYGLLYTLNGSEPSLKPLLFMAHQDVVPADGSSGWTYPPYAGYYDGSFVWGRGSSDCKNVLIGLLSAIESLLSQSFSPRRTIVLSFGFDEETGGKRGATELSQALVKAWGRDSFLLAMDEGGMGVQSLGDDVMYAYPGVGEKGYHDVELELRVRGGHSSRPPRHTGIGVMADVIPALEEARYEPRLTGSNPFRRVLECRAKYSPEQVEPWVHDMLRSGGEDLSRAMAEELGDEQWLVQTSQAVDVVVGGIKVNALPESVRLMINHRVMMHESIDFVNQHIHNALALVVQKHNLVFKSIGDKNESTSSGGGVLSMRALQTLPPAPLTPTGNNSVWQIFSGTLRQVFETTDAGRGKTVVPVGNIMTGNTDTVHYWDVTRNIYRYSPARDGTRLNAHAIDERMEVTAHLEGVRVYYDLIRNFDGWDEE